MLTNHNRIDKCNTTHWLHILFAEWLLCFWLTRGFLRCSSCFSSLTCTASSVHQLYQMTYYSAPLALQALYMLLQIRPSVCLSVTLWYCVKMRKRRCMQSSPLGSRVSLVFWCHFDAKNGWWGTNGPVQVKFECKEVDPLQNCQVVHISPHNSGTVTDSEKRSLNVNRKSTMGFPTSHQPRSCVTLNFPKMGFKYPNLSFSQKFQKPLNVCYKASLSKNFQQHKLIEWYQHFGRGWPHSCKIWT